MRKVGTDDIRERRKGRDEETYKVRVALSLAHYVLVTAKDQDEAEVKVRQYVNELDAKEGFDGWYREASHLNATFEVEEAD